LTESAESISQLFFIVVGSATCLTYSSIAYQYFKFDPAKAQLICFMLLALPKLDYLMYNDQVVSFLISLSLHTIVQNNSPWLASTYLGLALSMKAPVILIIPSYMGVLMYIYGLRGVLDSFNTIVFIQIALALPFIKNFGGGTDLWTYMEYAKYLGGSQE
jgi:hypothetical protein